MIIPSSVPFSFNSNPTHKPPITRNQREQTQQPLWQNEFLSVRISRSSACHLPREYIHLLMASSQLLPLQLIDVPSQVNRSSVKREAAPKCRRWSRCPEWLKLHPRCRNRWPLWWIWLLRLGSKACEWWTWLDKEIAHRPILHSNNPPLFRFGPIKTTFNVIGLCSHHFSYVFRYH